MRSRVNPDLRADKKPTAKAVGKNNSLHRTEFYHPDFQDFLLTIRIQYAIIFKLLLLD